jgi:hypothetical protein
VSDEKEPVGSVAEEAVKLLGALQGWAQENLHESADATASAASAFKDFHEHIATGGQGCKYCPVCQVLSAAREFSPEVKRHLSSAASSLLQALSAVRATQPEPHMPRRSEGPIEKIDLSDDAE